MLGRYNSLARHPGKGTILSNSVPFTNYIFGLLKILKQVTLKHKSFAFDCAGFLIICYFYDHTAVTRTLVATGV